MIQLHVCAHILKFKVCVHAYAWLNMHVDTDRQTDRQAGGQAGKQARVCARAHTHTKVSKKLKAILL